MKKLVNFVVLIGLLGLTTSCLDEMDVPMSDTEANTVSFIIEDFTPEAQTKSAFQTPTMKFRWSEDDVIGIFPEDGWQTQFNMESGAGGNTAVFDGGSWGLKDDATYYAYYPFSKENFEFMGKREYVSFSYEGQKAAFADGDGVVDVSGYDFMASGASTVDNGAVSFRFSHLGALCRVRFVAPAAAEYSHVSIAANSEMFNMTGYYDATDKDGDGVISYVSETGAASLSFSIPSGKGAFEADENVEFYFLMAPTDLSGQILTFRLVDNANNEYEAEVGGKEILAGSSYAWDIIWPGEGENPDDNIPAADATANCYIVSESGSYSFPTVMGNSSVSVGDVVSAEVLWESFGTDVAPEVGDLVTEVSYSKGMISYTVPSPFKEGNAVIAAKDGAGKILWSWHIWLTDKPKDQVYRNDAGTMMDRNLGATSATPGDVGALGLMYQWGRKDPFLGSSSISTSTKAKSTLASWPDPTASTESTGTIAYTIAHPTQFIKSNNNNYDWCFSSENYVTDNTRWQSVKTVYDPCPVGYRVPDGDYDGVWATAFNFDNWSFTDETAYDSTNEGFNFIEGSMNNYYLTDEDTCWYPAAGYLYIDYGSLYNTGDSGHYWSCTPDSDGAYSLSFRNSGNVYPSYDYNRAYGQSVRCLQE